MNDQRKQRILFKLAEPNKPQPGSVTPSWETTVPKDKWTKEQWADWAKRSSGAVVPDEVGNALITLPFTGGGSLLSRGATTGIKSFLGRGLIGGGSTSLNKPLIPRLTNFVRTKVFNKPAKDVKRFTPGVRGKSSNALTFPMAAEFAAQGLDLAFGTNLAKRLKPLTSGTPNASKLLFGPERELKRYKTPTDVFFSGPSKSTPYQAAKKLAPVTNPAPNVSKGPSSYQKVKALSRSIKTQPSSKKPRVMSSYERLKSLAGN